MNFKSRKYLYLAFAIIAMIYYVPHVNAGTLTTSDDSIGVSLQLGSGETIPVEQFIGPNTLIDGSPTPSMWELSNSTGLWMKSRSTVTASLIKTVTISVPDPIPALSADDVVSPTPIAPPSTYKTPVPSPALTPPTPTPASSSSSTPPEPNLSITVPVKPGTTTKAVDGELINPTTPNPPTSTTISKEEPVKPLTVPTDLKSKTNQSSEKTVKSTVPSSTSTTIPSTTTVPSSTSTAVPSSSASTTRTQSLSSTTNLSAHKISISQSLPAQSKVRVKSGLPKTGESQSSDYFLKFMGLTILALIGFWFKGNSKKKSGTSFQ